MAPASNMSKLRSFRRSARYFALGAHLLSVNYNGSAIFNAASSASVLQRIQAAQSRFSVATSGPANSTYGQPVTITGTSVAVAPATGTPTGTATFFDTFGGVTTTLGTITLVNGVVSLTIPNSLNTPLAVGTHTFEILYGGDGTFGQSRSATFTQVVAKPADTAITLFSATNPSTVDLPVVFSVTVSALAPSIAIPDGSVTLFDSIAGGAVGSANLVNGQATVTVTFTTVGTHQITASYSPTPSANPSFNPSSTTATTLVNQVVNNLKTASVTLSTSQNPSNLGDPIILTAIVTPLGTGTIPSGKVNFFDGTTLLNTTPVPLLQLTPSVPGSSAVATFTTGFDLQGLTVGSHNLTARYLGDDFGTIFNQSVSPIFVQVIGKANTAVTVVSSNSNISVWGQPVTFTVQVAQFRPPR